MNFTKEMFVDRLKYVHSEHSNVGKLQILAFNLPELLLIFVIKVQDKSFDE